MSLSPLDDVDVGTAVRLDKRPIRWHWWCTRAVLSYTGLELVLGGGNLLLNGPQLGHEPGSEQWGRCFSNLTLEVLRLRCQWRERVLNRLVRRRDIWHCLTLLRRL